MTFQQFFQLSMRMILTFALLTQTTSSWGQPIIQNFDPKPILEPIPFSQNILTGLIISADHPLTFQLVTVGSDHSSAPTAEDISTTAKYFLSAVSLPAKNLWVNLSPLEPDRIIPSSVGETQLGQELLVQDYFLKQITSSLMNPEGETGKKFWERVYEKLYTSGMGHGTPGQESPNANNQMLNAIESFNKVWIVPETAELHDTANAVYISKARLKVMLESDYLASGILHSASGEQQPNTNDQMLDAKQIIRDVILPLIEDEVNNSPTFAPLRQIYRAVILASWYKSHLSQSPSAGCLIDTSVTSGLNGSYKIDDVYAAYVHAFQKGAADLIKEEYDPLTQSVAPRHYFTGGADFAEMSRTTRIINTDFMPLAADIRDHGYVANISVDPANQAMLSVQKFLTGIKDLPLLRQISMIQSVIEHPTDNKIVSARLEQLRQSIRALLNEESHQTIIPGFKLDFYYDLLHFLIRQDSNEMTMRYFLKDHLLPKLKNTKQNQIMIAFSGKAASGKTTMALRIQKLKEYLRIDEQLPWTTLMLSYDDYLLQMEDRADPQTQDPLIKTNVKRFKNDMNALSRNEAVWAPIYDQKAKGQLKIGLDADGITPVIYNGNIEMTLTNGKIKIFNTIRNDNGQRIGRGEELKTISISKTSSSFSFGGIAIDLKINGQDIEIKFPESSHAIKNNNGQWSYMAEAKDPQILSAQPQEMLRYIAPLKNGDSKRMIVVEGFLTLTAADSFDFTVNVDADQRIRAWRSLRREILRGRDDPNFLAKHLHLLRQRQQTEDALIDRLTDAARRRNKPKHQVHFDVTNVSVSEKICSLFWGWGIQPGPINSFGAQEINLEMISKNLPQLQSKALEQWLSQQFAKKQTYALSVSGRTSKASSQKYFSFAVNDDVTATISFPYPNKIIDIGKTNDQQRLRMLHQRGRGVIAGFNVVNLRRPSISILLQEPGQQSSYSAGIERILLIDRLLPLTDQLQQSDAQQGETWIQQFFKTQYLMWHERGIFDAEPSIQDYGIKVFDNRNITMCQRPEKLIVDQNNIAPDRSPTMDLLEEIASLEEQSKNNGFISELIREYSADKELSSSLEQLHGFQLRFIGNSKTQENYLSYIPTHLRINFVKSILMNVPVNRQEMIRIKFGQLWQDSRKKDRLLGFKNQGLPLAQADNELLQYVSKTMALKFFEELKKRFENTYRSSTGPVELNPRLQWINDYLLVQSDDPSDYRRMTAEALLDLFITEADNIPQDAEQILQMAHERIKKQHGDDHIPPSETWEDRVLKKIVSYALELPKNWAEFRKSLNKKSDKAMMTSHQNDLNGGIDLSATESAAKITSSQVSPTTSAEKKPLSAIIPLVISIAPAQDIPDRILFGNLISTQ